ncbi:hypothetical protein [Streptomyces sp. MNP-20]|uniref:hypothetical protein n=1 Tax=Streptomyces sp. MNP-20 TaxID=2721165 RepID=UPI001552FE4F|nr:hypothetical protein [Streptomyces sp. MNP-20]
MAELFYEFTRATSDEVALAVQEVENYAYETEVAPEQFTTYDVAWVDSVSWNVASRQATPLEMRGKSPSGIKFNHVARPGIPGCKEHFRRRLVSCRVEIPGRTRAVISVVGNHQVERCVISGDATGELVVTQTGRLQVKVTLLTSEGDHRTTRYLSAQVSEVEEPQGK